MKIWITVVFLCVTSFGWSQISLSKKNESCAGRNDGSITVNVAGVSAQLDYQWAFNGTPFQGGKTITGLKPGDYTVTVSTEGGCMGHSSAKVWPGGDVSVSIAAHLLNITPTPLPCGQRPTFTYRLTAITQGGTPPYYCSFDQGGGMNGECQKVVSGEIINETVMVIDSNKCVDTEAFKVIGGIRFCPKDPNDITGPAGYDTAQWVARKEVMDYTVRFENDPVFATSNASLVFITVPIDDDIDPFSFRLNAIGFGSKFITMPDNANLYQERIDYAEELGFHLDVTAGLDITNNRFFWLLETIDPLTGQPPTDPLAGFLPVNDTLTGSGEGFVTFSCKPKSTTLTGEVVSHQASIVFDANEPLLTNTWTNTVDAFAPTTVTTPIDDTLYSNEVPFEWVTQDDFGGCGVQYSQILTSTTTGNFISSGLFANTNEHTVSLQWGTKYYYKVIGADHVNNVEEVALDSFYIVPERNIEFILPDKTHYCIFDTLYIDPILTSIPDADIYVSIDSGETYTPLATGVTEWPYTIILDSAYLSPDVIVKLINPAQSIEGITRTVTVHTLPDLTLSVPSAGCENEHVFAEANGASFYQWWPEEIMGSPTDRYTNVYAHSSQMIYVGGADGFGCITYDSAFLQINPISTDTFNQPLCEGDSIQIDGQWVSEEGYYPYTLTNALNCDSIVTAFVQFENPCIWTGGQYVYVHESATGLNNGTSWANAFNDLQDALYVAERYENVQEIWVAEGQYKPHSSDRAESFILNDSIKIYGGFIGVETSREERTPDASLVLISGDINIQDTIWDNTYHVVQATATCVECVLDGLTIHYGYANEPTGGNDRGAGLLTSGKLTLGNVIFERNFATDLGAALHASGALSNVIVENCTFRLNNSSFARDVVNLDGSNLTFRGANLLQ